MTTKSITICIYIACSIIDDFTTGKNMILHMKTKIQNKNFLSEKIKFEYSLKLMKNRLERVKSMYKNFQI